MPRYEPTDDEVKQAIKDAGDLEANDAVYVLRAFAKSQFPQPIVWVRDVTVGNVTHACLTTFEVSEVVKAALDDFDATIVIGSVYGQEIDETTSGDR